MKKSPNSAVNINAQSLNSIAVNSTLKGGLHYPCYSPEFNLIEILWRLIKYEWLDIDAYRSWDILVSSVEKILKEFGSNYVINFV